MALKDTLQNAVETAFTAVADITQDVVYTNPGITTYNTTTGVNDTVGASTSTIKAIFIANPNNLDRMADVEKAHPQLLIKRSDFTETLAVNGYFTVSGDKFEVVSWSVDPSDSLYTIDVARST
jgi:hypothetical protein